MSKPVVCGLWLSVGMLAAGTLGAVPAPKHDIIPSPQEYRAGEGVFTLRAERIDATAASFTTDAAIGPEGYRLKVTEDGIAVASSGAAGAFYAVETLKQMARRKGDGTWEIPCAEIDDRPQYAYRGIMIDESRHFFGKAFILNLLDKMSRYKLNALHWHLNDDCGFREPFDFDPKMAKEGATRPFKTVLDVKTGTAWDPDPNVQQEIKARAPSKGPDYGPYSYTKADIREVLDFAAARHIRVIPELEVPGHATGLLRAHPEFCCLDKDGKPLDPETCMEICVGNPEALAWYDRAFDETFALFPDPIVHIGGDEVNPKHWNACPRCQAFMKERGIKDWNGLQAWVTKRCADRIRKAGKRLGGWDDIYYQDAPKDAVIWCPGAIQVGCAAMAGYDVVRCDNGIFYFDWPQGLKDDPCQYIGWKPEVNTFAEVWSTRVSCELPETCRDRVMGAEACLWAEFTRSPKELEWKIWPRAIALAENLWRHGGNPISGRYNDFRRRARREVEWLRKEGINCAPFEGMEAAGDDAGMSQAHRAAADRERTYVYNTDGCDMLYYPTNSRINVDAFIGQRLGFVRQTKATTVSYCPLSSGFGYFCLLGVGDPLTHDVVPNSSTCNGTLPFAKIGHDCLEMAMTFCREQGYERFMSIRMNDSHDGSSRPHEGKFHPLFSEFRRRHPEYLMGNPEKDEWPEQCSWQWTCVDYSHKEVRDYVRKFVRDFCEKYDMEGIEFDFCRHPKYFKRCSYGETATDAERALMTELVLDLRKIAREYEVKKGHPILLNARVPDSVEYCRDIGLDLKAWLEADALDGIIGGCYFNLNDWKVMADFVHGYGAKFYASIDESRIPGACRRWNRPMIPGRDTVENYCASYAQAMKAGADGIYLFNLEHDSLVARTQFDPRDTDGRDKIYFATQRGKGGYEPIHYLKDGYRYKNLPYIDPATDPKTVLKDQSGLHDPGLDIAVQYAVEKRRTFELRLGDDFAAAAAKGRTPTITVMALTTGLTSAKEAAFTLNGVDLKGFSCSKGCAATSAKFENGLITYENVAPAIVKCGINVFTVEPTDGKPFVLNDFAVKVEYR